MTIITFDPKNEQELIRILKDSKQQVTITGVEVTYKIKENLQKETLDILRAQQVISKYMLPA